MTDLNDKKLKIKNFSLIKSDLKRLKKFKSLESDVDKALRVAKGKIIEMRHWPPPIQLDRGLITSVKTGATVIYCFKRNVPVISAGLYGNNGCRLIYGVDEKNFSLFSILVYAAKEEGESYAIDNKKFHLKLEGIKAIIKTKLRLL